MSASEPAQNPVPQGDPTPASFDPQSIEGLFLAALQQPAGPERDAYLDEVCGTDADRRRRVIALLRAYEDVGSFLETPAGGQRLDQTVDELRLDFLTPTDRPGCVGLLGPYEVIDVIGKGGMGIVLRALDPKLNRVVAVKVLAPHLAVNPNARKRFLREAQAAAAVSHPHVVTIHAVEEGVPTGDHSTLNAQHATLPYLVMECVVGQSLQDKLDKVGSLGVTEILRISHQIAMGLAAAHKQGLIHRDIKPANILLENGVERVKITDFGLARLVDDVAITRTGEVSGTPQYMSPEQAKGERVDHRSDLFSLGCVMYAMCTGHSPFRGDSLAHVIKRVTQDEPRPIEELNPDVPRWLAEIVGRLLEKSPEQRFQTAGEIGELLGVHLARQQHAGPDALSHSGINARHLATASPQRPSARRTSASPSRPGSQTAGSATLFVGIPWYVRLFGALVLIASLSVVVSQFALTYLTRTDPSIAPRAGGAASHLITSLLWLLPLFVGVLLSRKWISVQFLLVALFLGLGPIGVVLWMLQRERWERTAVDTEAAREIDMRDRQSMYSSALKTTLGATIIAAMVTVSLFHALPGEELRQHFAALVQAAAIALGCIFAVVSMSKLSDGVDRRSLMMTVGAVFWTVLCVPLLCMVGQEAAIAKNASEPFGSLLALIAAGWLIPVAGLLYLLHRRELAASDASVPDASAPLTKRERAWLGFGGVIVWLGSICAMLLIDRDGRLPWGIGAVEWGAILFVGSLVLGIPLLVLWLLLRRREGDDRTLRQRVDDARGQPGKLLAWLAIGCLLLFVVLPVLLIGVGLIVPMFARVDTVRVLVDYDPAAPLTEIRTESGIVYQVSSRPQPIRLPAGRRALHLQYQDSGVPHYLSTTITIPESYVGRELTVDLRNEIAADLHREIEPEFSALPDDAVAASGGVESYGGLDPFPFPSGSMEGGSAEASAELGQLAAATSGPPVAWTTETDSRATMRSGLHVQMLGEGLVLALRKKSLFEGTIGEKETIISEFGNVWGGLEKGEYEWLYRDLHFGWAYDRRGSVTLLDPKQGTLVVRRNLATAIQPAVALPARGGFGVPQPAISQFRWNGDQYDLDPNQSLIVQQLANAAITTEPAVREDQLVAELNRQIVRWSNSPGSFGAFGLSGHSGGGSPSPGSNIVSPVEALKQVFDTASGLHPAWGTLIVPGEESDTFRLAPIELGVLKFNQTDSTRAVTVHTPSGEMESLTPGERSLTLTPGDYAVEFIPEQPDVAWMRPSSDGYVSFPARRTVSVDAGETTVLSLTHELNDAVTPRPLINVPQARDLTVPGYLLRWFGHGNLPAGESPAPPLVDERVYALNDYQALCIGRLMQGIVQQQPDVAESTIVDVAKRAGFMPPEAPADTEPYSGLNEVFPGLQDGSWQALLTPGEQPDTWRLHLPSQD